MACNSTKPRNNLNPSTWGPYAWSFLYAIAVAYPSTPSVAERAAMKNFVFSLPYLLPCQTCRTNMETKLNGEFGGLRLETALNCNTTLVDYFYDIETSIALSKQKTVVPKNERIQQALAPPHVLAARLDHAQTTPNAVWIVLPIAVVVTAAATYGITVFLQKKQRQTL